MTIIVAIIRIFESGIPLWVKVLGITAAVILAVAWCVIHHRRKARGLIVIGYKPITKD